VIIGSFQKCTDKLFAIYEPDSKPILIWNFITLIAILVDTFYVPFLLCFWYEEYEEAMDILEYLLLVFFILNFMMNFNVAYYSKGIAVKNRRKIIRHYIKGRFWIDSLALLITIPRVVIGYEGLIYFEVIRMLRLSNIKYYISKLQDYLQLSLRWLGIIRLIKLWSLLIIFSHAVACIMHLIGRMTSPNSWLNIFGFADQTMFQRYIASTYWSVATIVTVGYGDITPQNEYERLFTIVFMLIATAVFGYTMNTVSTIIGELNEDRAQAK